MIFKVKNDKLQQGFSDSSKKHELHKIFLTSRFKWLAVVLLAVLNFLITYSLKSMNSKYFMYFITDLAITYLVFEFFIFGIKFLDKKTPLHKNLLIRIEYQFIIHSLLVLIFDILINELFDFIFFNSQKLSLSLTFYTQDMLLALFLILFLQVLYFGLFFMSNYLNSRALKQKKISVLSGGTEFKLVNLEEVICIYSSFGNTYIIDKNFKKYSSTKKLKDFEDESNAHFFKANRQFIISKDILGSYRSADYGKVEISLKEIELVDLPNTITISRDKASLFRAWIKEKSL